MTEWIDNLAAKTQNGIKALAQADERFNTEQKLKTDLAGDFWHRLIARLKEYALEYNNKIGSQIISVEPALDHAFEVAARFARDHRKATRVRFSPDRKVIEWGNQVQTIAGTGQAYLLELAGDSQMVAVVSAGQNVKFTPEDIAREIITFVVDYR